MGKDDLLKIWMMMMALPMPLINVSKESRVGPGEEDYDGDGCQTSGPVTMMMMRLKLPDDCSLGKPRGTQGTTDNDGYG